MIARIRQLPWLAQLLLALGIAKFITWGVLLNFATPVKDYELVYIAARQVLTGHPELLYQAFLHYDPVHSASSLFYMYPPTVALMYVPFALLPYDLSAILFQLISLLATYGAVRL